MSKENGLESYLDQLRVGLNPSHHSEGIEYLYAHNLEGNRRWLNLVSYLEFMLEEQPEVLLIGEAPGYRGTGVSGVPFLSEGMIKLRRLNNSRLPFTAYNQSTVYDQSSGFEATSKAMWNVLDTYSPQRLPLLWAVFPNHPYGTDGITSNRKPTKKEIRAYVDVTGLLIKIYNIKYIVAVGNVAYDTFTTSTDYPIVKLRHPARGGVKKFGHGFSEFMERKYGDRK